MINIVIHPTSFHLYEVKCTSVICACKSAYTSLVIVVVVIVVVIDISVESLDNTNDMQFSTIARSYS